MWAFTPHELGLAMRAESEQQAHDSAVDGSTPPRRGQWAGAGAALAEIARERAERGSEGDGDEKACHKRQYGLRQPAAAVHISYEPHFPPPQQPPPLSLPPLPQVLMPRGQYSGQKRMKAVSSGTAPRAPSQL